MASQTPASPDPAGHSQPPSDGSRSSHCAQTNGRRPPSKLAGRRISRPGSRRILFTKRRKGLLKRARELSVLSDAEVAVIVFHSATGTLTHFASSSMPEILKRYQDLQYQPALQEANVEFKSKKEEAIHSTKQVGHSLDDLQRHLNFDNVDGVSFKDLQTAESNLELIQQRINARKNDLLQMYTPEITSKVKYDVWDKDTCDVPCVGLISDSQCSRIMVMRVAMENPHCGWVRKVCRFRSWVKI